jgi:predicted transposase/invertase (TIGR01784 family)
MRFADIKNDIAFRKIFGNKKKTICLISFLNAVLGLEGSNRVIKVTLIDPYLVPRIRGEKASIIDVRATDMRGRQFIIEMQVADKKGFGKRVQYYTAKDYSLQLLSGDDYQLLNPTYFIGILNFPFGANPSYYTKHTTTDEETGEHLLADMQYAFIQLTKFKKKESELVTMVDKWTYFLKNARKLKLVPDNTDDEGLKEAYEEAEMFNWSKEMLMSYTVANMRQHDVQNELEKANDDGVEKGIEIGIEIGIEKGIEKGIEQGAKNEKLDVARNALIEGATVSFVSKVTGLPIEAIQKIADELN